MELYLDTADVRAIRELSDTLTISGVTTNPSIVATTARSEAIGADEVIRRVLEALSPEQTFFAQTIQTSTEGMVEDAKKICSLRENTYVKIPATAAGLQAIKRCKKLGLPVLATAIYSADQAFLAAMNGADYLAPYVNRMYQFGDGVAQVIELLQMLEEADMPARVVAASFKNAYQVHELMLAGVHAVTVAPDVVRQLYLHPAVEPAVEVFGQEWFNITQKNKF